VPWYGLFIERQMEGATKSDFLTGTWQYSLHTATYSPNQDTDGFFNVATNEVTGTNYTANGVTLGSKTSTYDTATDEWRFDAADAAWTTATIAGCCGRTRLARALRIRSPPTTTSARRA
jgi:hypothetical protein